MVQGRLMTSTARVACYERKRVLQLTASKLRTAVDGKTGGEFTSIFLCSGSPSRPSDARRKASKSVGCEGHSLGKIAPSLPAMQSNGGLSLV